MRNSFVVFLFLIDIHLFGQVPTCDFKMPDATTTFAINVAIGQKVYEIDTKQLFLCYKGIIAGNSISSSASGSLRDLGDYNQLSNKPTIPSGTVTAVSVATANGISGSSSGGATPALTIALGAITPTSTIWSTPGSNSTGTGNMITLTAASTSGVGDVGYINSSGQVAFCKADVIADCPYAFCICAQATISTGSSGSWVTHGMVRKDSWSWTVGGLMYVSTTGTTGNTLTQIAPTGANNVIMPVGIALSATVVFFYGNMNSVEHL